ncbi:MAG: rhomboid family intramembrane serine protease [Proteobacteria bacterium]|nr:rhomboid family intramembrane serine protease [Pseudomonadota bacterium]
MRSIGEIKEEAAARKFSDFLHAQGLRNELERDEAGGWQVWVKSDDDLPAATEWLTAYRLNPADARFGQAEREAAAVRAKEAQDLAEYRKRVTNARTMFPSLRSYRFGPLTFVLIAVCVFVFVATKLGTDFERVHSLWISNFLHRGTMWERVAGLQEVNTGEVWRLVTPIFIHMGLIHIVFNMMWLADLGSMIEGRQSSSLLGWLVLGLAVGSNLVQYAYTGNPRFGGMSGVIYGLIGYMWIRSKFDPGCGLQLNRQIVVVSLVWLGLCFTGWLGAIAHGCHVGGLVIGMAWGWLASRRRSD